MFAASADISTNRARRQKNASAVTLAPATACQATHILIAKSPRFLMESSTMTTKANFPFGPHTAEALAQFGFNAR